MHRVVADTGPIHYLILIGHIDLLPKLFGQVVVPSVVLAELSHERAPFPVRAWAATPPEWVEIAESPAYPLTPGIHRGEAAALALGSQLNADMLLMDDRRGVIAAGRDGLNVTGTLGVLSLAAERSLIDFPRAIEALRATTFRIPISVLDELLSKHKES